MKTTTSLFLITLITSCTLLAQTKEETDVAAAVESLRKALIDGEKKALEDIAAAELSYGHSSGLVEDKAAFVENIVSGKSDFVAITITDQTIVIAGNNAIVRHKMAAETNNGGVPGKINLAVLLVWQQQRGQWKLLARQTTRVNP